MCVGSSGKIFFGHRGGGSPKLGFYPPRRWWWGDSVKIGILLSPEGWGAPEKLAIFDQKYLLLGGVNGTRGCVSIKNAQILSDIAPHVRLFLLVHLCHMSKFICNSKFTPKKEKKYWGGAPQAKLSLPPLRERSFTHPTPDSQFFPERYKINISSG